jgi:hypothetical protein
MNPSFQFKVQIWTKVMSCIEIVCELVYCNSALATIDSTCSTAGASFMLLLVITLKKIEIMTRLLSAD